MAALATAGVAWGASVPLSKVGLTWLAPGWLTAARFGLAAVVLLLAVPRAALRAAFAWRVLAAGAFGYGGSVLLQNAGIARTSVTHAALLTGAVPVLVAIIAAVWQHAVARPVAWAGFALSLAGVAATTGGHGGATRAGDVLVLASALLSAVVTVAQGRVLANRDPVAVTAIQFSGAALVALPVAVTTEGLPGAPGAGAVLAVLGLTAVGTVAPFTLFAYGQRRVPAELAGAFLNLEPLVGAVAGVVAFGDPAGPRQLAGGIAIIAGIALSSLPLLRGNRPGRRPAPPPGGQQTTAQMASAQRASAQMPRWGSRSAIEPSTSGSPGSPVMAGTAASSWLVDAPVSTPATRPAPARRPDSTSLGVSPATASSRTEPPPSRMSAVSGRSGQGRPRPASAGDSTRSTRPPQPSAVTIASLVAGEKPVARHTFIPASLQAANTSTAPGIGVTAPARTAAA